MKKAMMIIVLIIGAAFMSFNLHKSSIEQNAFGAHRYLLGDHLSREDIDAYCLSHGLDPKQLVVYVAEYSLVNTKADFKQHSLPIYNPEAIKSLLAVSSSIPIEESDEAQDLTIAFHADVNWLKKQPVGSLKEKLVVKYLMSLENVNAVDELAKNAGKPVLEADKDSSEYELIQQITDSVDHKEMNVPSTSLKQQVKTYVKWICNHISYPAEDIKDSLRGTVINLDNAEKTIHLGMGVCSDNVEILYKILQYKGIESFVATGYIPNSTSNMELLPSNYTHHASLLVHSDRGYYLVDPTLQNTNENEVFALQNGMKVRGSKKNKFNEDYRSFPMFINKIEGLPAESSALIADLQRLSIHKLVE